jgi:methyltransferase (TIGR00027 family)
MTAMSDQVAIRSAETMAFMRAVVSGEKNLVVRSEDRMARHFLGSKYRLLVSLGQCTLRRLLEFAVPGSYGFTIARTRHFDEVLSAECLAGVEQVVLLGAGYDSRPFRLREALQNVRIFELDHPGTQARKRRLLSRTNEQVPANLTFIPVDFRQQSMSEALEKHGFVREKKTIFLWEGVSYYLPRPVVESVLAYISGCAAGSSVVFDYATKAYVDGDTSTLGGKQVARWLESVRERFVFGLEPGESEGFLAAQHLSIVSQHSPEELADAYLKSADGHRIGGLFGHIRMVHARATGTRSAAGDMKLAGFTDTATTPNVAVRRLNDRLRQTFTGGRMVVSPGVLGLPAEARSSVLDRVRTFDAFEPENQELRDFGKFRFGGVSYCFELERSRLADDRDFGDGRVSSRVMTVMRYDEY